MQHSYYNVAVESEKGEHILFNTLHGSLAVLNDEVYMQYTSLAGEHLKSLKNAGFIVESADSEIARQRVWFERDKNSKETLALCIAPTYECNLACPHCYEKDQKISTTMSEQTIAYILAFVRKVYVRDRYTHLFVTWHGGEPTLCIDTLETLSEHLIAFCKENGIAYGAEIFTNATGIDTKVSQRLAACHIKHAHPTLAGCEQLHDSRRPSKKGKGSYRHTLKGAQNMKSAGISVGFLLSMDKESCDELLSLREYLASEGFNAMPSIISDYSQDMLSDQYLARQYTLFSREEFSWVAYKWFEGMHRDASTLAPFLSPLRNFCRKQLENYFVIDALGDVYKCDGRMGRKEFKLFNIADSIDVDALQTATDNPMDDELCKTCSVMPLCKGQCSWDRAVLEDGCHPLKYTISQYVKDYRKCFGAADDPVTLFVAPRDLEEYFSRPALGEGLSASVYG